MEIKCIECNEDQDGKDNTMHLTIFIFDPKNKNVNTYEKGTGIIKM